MNVPRMLTVLNQSWPVYFIFSTLLFFKIIHIFNLIFSFNFFINQVIKIFTIPYFFPSEIQSNFKSVLFTSSFSRIFITETLALFQVSFVISKTIFYIHKKNKIFYDCFFIFHFFIFYFYFLFFLSLISHYAIS